MAMTDRECPTDCPEFKCITMPKECSSECLNEAKNNLCSICSVSKRCSDIQRQIYSKNLLKKESRVIEPLVLSPDKVMELLHRHYYLEQCFADRKKRYGETPSWNIFSMALLRREGGQFKTELRYLRKFLDEIGLRYKRTIRID